MKRLIFILFIGITGIGLGQYEGSGMTDNDGKFYKTIIIGTQEWMAENLAYKTSIGNIWAYDDDVSNVESKGFLYDWNAARNACPNGWHLPSDMEWSILADYLGDIKYAGRKLKADEVYRTKIKNIVVGGYYEEEWVKLNQYIYK